MLRGRISFTMILLEFSYNSKRSARIGAYSAIKSCSESGMSQYAKCVDKNPSFFQRLEIEPVSAGNVNNRE